MTIATPADVRKLMPYVPAERRKLSAWCCVADRLADAAAGADPADVAAALLLVPARERVPCRPR